MTFFKNILRFPGLSIHPIALTNIGSIDDYLKELDSRLFGSKNVRAPKVLEIKSHLMEMKNAYKKEGYSEIEAAKKAVMDIGYPDEFSSDANGNLHLSFLKTFLSAGALFSVLRWFLDQLNNPPNIDFTIFYIVMNFIYFGIPVGLLLTYYLQFQNLEEFQKKDFPFRVGHTLLVRGFFFLVGIPFLALFLQICQKDLLPILMGEIEFTNYKLPIYLMMFAYMVKVTTFDSMQSIIVDKNEFIITKFFRKTHTIKWKNVYQVKRLKTHLDFLPNLKNNFLRRKIRYKTETGEIQTIKINRRIDSPNILRFIAITEKAVMENSK